MNEQGACLSNTLGLFVHLLYSHDNNSRQTQAAEAKLEII